MAIRLCSCWHEICANMELEFTDLMTDMQIGDATAHPYRHRRRGMLMIYEERDAEIRRAWMEECWAAIGGRSALELEQLTQVPANRLHAYSSHGERPQPMDVVRLARATQGGDWADWAHRVLRLDRKSTRLNSSHIQKSRMPSSA